MYQYEPSTIKCYTRTAEGERGFDGLDMLHINIIKKSNQNSQVTDMGPVQTICAQ